MSITIGASLPNVYLKESDFCHALNRVKTRLSKLNFHSAQNDDTALNIQFFLPGKYESLRFNGIRISGFDVKTTTVYLEISVPKSIVYSDYAEEFLVAEIEEAIENVSYFLKEMRIPFDHASYTQLMDTIQPAIKSEPLQATA